MMNDRFKFRVWDNENNKMFTPLRHFNYSNVNGTIVCIESFCQYDGFYQKRIIKEFNDAILMQCTGLKDKNGKLIYEFDVVKDENNALHYVKWVYDSWQLFPCTQNNYTIGIVDDEIEVIGNIYENPELNRRNRK